LELLGVVPEERICAIARPDGTDVTVSEHTGAIYRFL
jgi:hypothetical protein